MRSWKIPTPFKCLRQINSEFLIYYINLDIFETPITIISNMIKICTFRMDNKLVFCHLHSIRNHIFENQILIRIKFCFLWINDNGPRIDIFFLIVRNIFGHRPIGCNISLFSFAIITVASIYTYANCIIKPVFSCSTCEFFWAKRFDPFNRNILGKLLKGNGFLFIIYRIIYILL